MSKLELPDLPSEPNKKYKLIPEEGTTLLRFVALRVIPRWCVASGEKGGLIQKEENLSQDGEAWVFGSARVYGEARVSHPSHLLRVSGLRFHITVTAQSVVGGCREFTHDAFRALTLAECNTPGWTEEELRRFVFVLVLFHPTPASN